ncbi:hypothetical protein OF83DRAFT_1136020 [Amylostereum chailletii]|nr:hypothetical protein OF83DRAFT_1136020 [Amylostereum chailletii]
MPAFLLCPPLPSPTNGSRKQLTTNVHPQHHVLFQGTCRIFCSRVRWRILTARRPSPTLPSFLARPAMSPLKGASLLDRRAPAVALPTSSSTTPLLAAL